MAGEQVLKRTLPMLRLASGRRIQVAASMTMHLGLATS